MTQGWVTVSPRQSHTYNGNPHTWKDAPYIERDMVEGRIGDVPKM